MDNTDIGSPESDLTPQQKQARALLNKESIWIRPKDARALLQMRPERLLPYLAARDRAENGTGRLVWDKRALIGRAGGGTPRALDPKRTPSLDKDGNALPDSPWREAPSALAQYETAGLLTAIAPAKRGLPFEATLPKVPGNARIVIPLSVIWETRWDRNDHGTHNLRHGKQTARVIRAVLVELLNGQFSEGGLTITGSDSHGTARTLHQKAKTAGIAYGTYRRDWDALINANPAWLEIEQTVREDNGADAYLTTIRWELRPSLTTSTPLPTREAGQATSTHPSEQGVCTHPSSGDGTHLSVGGHTHLGTLYKETGSLAGSLSGPPPSSSAPKLTLATGGGIARHATKSGGKAAHNQSLSNNLDAALTGHHTLKAATTADNNTHTFDDWITATTCQLVAVPEAKRLDLKTVDITNNERGFRAAYNLGWTSSTLAEALTILDSADVRFPDGVLRKRLDSLPKAVNVVTRSRSGREQREDAAYEHRAQARVGANPARYQQREM